MSTTPPDLYEAHYVAQGEGRPVVLLHGFAASLHDWDYLAPTLAAEGYRSCALDLLGHGRSPKPGDREAYHIETLYTHLACWLEKIKPPQPPILLGHSLGAFLCLIHALRQPGAVRALVLVAPLVSPGQFSPLLRWGQRFPPWGMQALQLAPTWLIDATLSWGPNEAARFQRSRRQQKAADYKQAAPQVMNIPRSIEDLTADLSAVTMPTLVIWGQNDRTLAPQSFPQLVKAIPNAVGRALPDCGHQPHLARPVRFSRLVLDFMQGL